MPLEIFHISEYPRTILVVYEYDNFRKVIRYGATIHTSQNSSIPYNRSKHMMMALYRYRKQSKTAIIDLDQLSLKDREIKIRKLLYQYGC